MIIPSDLVETLLQAGKIAILTHASPDGDAIGSSLALSRALLSLGKNVDLLCQDSIPDIYEFLADTKLFRNYFLPGAWYDTAVIVDCSDAERLGSLSEIFRISKKTINIDHHVTNTYFADINFVSVTAAATAEIIYELILSMVGKLDLNMAEALYTGILTDTGNFSYSNVTSNTHCIAAELILLGVNSEKIAMLVYKNHSYNKIKLWGKAIDSLEIDFKGKFAMIAVTAGTMEDNEAKEFDVEGVINFALDIKGVELAVLVRELANGSVKVSFRSKSGLDVSKLAAQFGGGGHKKAAGCMMKEGIEKSKAIIKSAAMTVLNNLEV